MNTLIMRGDSIMSGIDSSIDNPDTMTSQHLMRLTGMRVIDLSSAGMRAARVVDSTSVSKHLPLALTDLQNIIVNLPSGGNVTWLLHVGANDILNGTTRSAIKSDYKAFVTKVKESGSQCIIMSPVPQYSAIVPEYALLRSDLLGVATAHDCYFLDGDTMLDGANQAMFADDRHLSELGRLTLAQNIDNAAIAAGIWL